jgi:tyrosyl-tRNA synthetase
VSTVAENVREIQAQFENVLEFTGPRAAVIVDNAEWLTRLGYLEVLRDVGRHFTVNMMIQKDSVRERLHNREQGISYTEFSYMILQAYDFLHLNRSRGVTVQLGGSDQWGNIVAGVDLVRKVEHREVFGITAPLVTKADGGKFGKTEAGAIWMSAERTSPYAYYQFWVNTADQDVERFLKIYTLLSRQRIEELAYDHGKDPSQRIGQHALAEEATRLLHGEAGLGRARAATAALFSGQVRDLDLQTLKDAFGQAPTSRHSKDTLVGQGVSLVDLLPETTLASSKREAREFLGNGAVSLNGERVDVDTRLTQERLLHGSLALLRRGKKAWHVTRWE